MGRRVAVKNQARALLRSLGVEARAGKALWSGKGLAWLKAVPLEGADHLFMVLALSLVLCVAAAIGWVNSFRLELPTEDALVADGGVTLRLAVGHGVEPCCPGPRR